MPNPFYQQQDMTAARTEERQAPSMAPAPPAGPQPAYPLAQQQQQAAPQGQPQQGAPPPQSDPTLGEVGMYADQIMQRFAPYVQAPQGMTTDERLGLFAVALSHPGLAMQYAAQRQAQVSRHEAQVLSLREMALQGGLKLVAAKHDAAMGAYNAQLKTMLTLQQLENMRAKLEATNAGTALTRARMERLAHEPPGGGRPGMGGIPGLPGIPGMGGQIPTGGGGPGVSYDAGGNGMSEPTLGEAAPAEGGLQFDSLSVNPATGAARATYKNRSQVLDDRAKVELADKASRASQGMYQPAQIFAVIRGARTYSEAMDAIGQLQQAQQAAPSEDLGAE